MEQLRTAISLKRAIEKVIENSTSIEPIGTSPTEIFDWEFDNGNFEEEFEEEEEQQYYDRMTNRVSNLKEASKSYFYHTFLPNSFNIRISSEVYEYKGKSTLKQPAIKKLYETSKEAGFGDLKNLKTVVNKDVRNAHDISDFEIGGEIGEEIAKEWSLILYPKKVRVVPYKINIYTCGGHFDEHIDTAEKDLIGTAIVSLWDTDAHYIPILKIKDKLGKQIYKWEPSYLSCILFYSDCPHKVKAKHGYEDAGTYRATLTFKIFSDETLDTISIEKNKERDIIQKTISALKVFNDKIPYGFLLGYGYSLDTKTLKGSDAIIIKALEKMGKKLTIIPVVKNFYLYSYHNDYGEDKKECKVFPFTEEVINYLINNESKPNIPWTNITFYNLGKSYEWSSDNQDYVEYTGNEAQPEEINSIYLDRAVIIE